MSRAGQGRAVGAAGAEQSRVRQAKDRMKLRGRGFAEQHGHGRWGSRGMVEKGEAGQCELGRAS